MPDDSSIGLLTRALREEVAARAPGDRLPSTRHIVEQHRVSPVTVSRALAALAAEGAVVIRPGAGTFVAASRPPAAAPADVTWQTVALGGRTIDAGGMSPLFGAPQDETTISLATGYLHGSLMPTRLLAAAWARAARLPDAFDRPPLDGIAGLRAWFARAADPGGGVEARDVLITPGGQASISAVFRALVAPGAPLLFESPTYPGALAVARAAGIRPVPVPADGRGVIPEHLIDAFERTGAQAVYLQPTFQNPAGTVLAAERRGAVLEAAAAAGAFVIEDDFARWLSHDLRPPAPLIAADRDGRVVYITSLTKATAPSLRIGAVVARGPVAERVRALRVVDDMFVARPVQEAALELVSRPGWERHLRQLADALRERALALRRGVAELVPAAELTAPPAGGMHLWMRLPRDLDDRQVERAAREHGVAVVAGRPFHPAEPPGPRLRLTFSAARDAAALDEGLRRLARAVPALRG
jgi:DNA-binding transcriptional MocR family regulator